MRLSPKILITIVGVIALLITVGTLIAYYRASLINFNGSINKDYLSAFGSFIGGTVGIVLSFASFILIFYTYQTQQKQLTITRELVNRQISLSIKPDIVISDFYTSDIANDDTQNEDSSDGILPLNLQDIELEILNVGIEVARYIDYKFEYNPIDLISYLNTHFTKLEIEIEYSLGSQFGEVKHIETEKEMSINMLSPNEPRQKDHLMPFKLAKDKMLVFIPYFYVLAYYYCIREMFKSDKFPQKNLTLDNFPSCLLKISYLDLEARKYEKTFDIKIDLSRFSLNLTSSGTQLIITAIEMYQNPF